MGDFKKIIHSYITHALFSTISIRKNILEGKGKKGLAISGKNKEMKPMDGIWGSIGINISSVGYLPFNQGPNLYHRHIWVRIYHIGSFGDTSLPLRDPGQIN